MRLCWRKLRTFGLARFRANLESRIELHHWLREATLGTCDCCDSASGSLRDSLLLGAWFFGGGRRCQVGSVDASMPSEFPLSLPPSLEPSPPLPCRFSRSRLPEATGTCLTVQCCVSRLLGAGACSEADLINSAVAGYVRGSLFSISQA